jgi:pyrimidine-nucleoside phosphorylase
VEAVEVLRGDRPGRLTDLTVEFAGAAQAALVDVSEEEGRLRAREAMSSGGALDSFRRMIEAQGGDARVVDDPTGVLPRAPVVTPIATDRSGFLASVDAEAIGRSAVALGAGRTRKGDSIDPAVGIVFRAKIGDRVEPEEQVGEVHARGEDMATAAVRSVNESLRVVDHPVEAPLLVYGVQATGGG